MLGMSGTGTTQHTILHFSLTLMPVKVIHTVCFIIITCMDKIYTVSYKSTKN